MYRSNQLFRISLFILLLTVCLSFRNTHSRPTTILNGAWQLQGSADQEVAIFSDGYFMITSYSMAGKRLNMTYGGTYQFQNNQLTITQEFNSAQKEAVGQTASVPLNIQGNTVTVENDGNMQTWKRIDNGTGPLTGLWRSGGRLQDGKVTFNPLGARRTFKLLTGGRFQWTAMNTETREMMATGGGSYTFINGKYTEDIEFFSRDSSRVGTSVMFDDKVENEYWYHKGKNTRGEPLSEIWGKVNM